MTFWEMADWKNSQYLWKKQLKNRSLILNHITFFLTMRLGNNLYDYNPTTTMYNTDRKGSQRASHNRQSAYKPRVDSTGLGLSIRFKEPREAQQEVHEFNEELSPLPIHELIKDMNYLNSIFNHILVMISSHLNTSPDAKNLQLVKMSKEIQRIIMKNLQLKTVIDSKHKNMTDLHQLAKYLQTTPNQLKDHLLSSFLADFEEKEKIAQRLSAELTLLENAQKSKEKAFISNQNIKQKQQKCKALRKVIDKERQRISKLQQEERHLMRQLYDTQNQITKNQYSNSAIKLKLTEAETSQKRVRAKTKEGRTEGKENQPLGNTEKNRCIQMGQVQRLGRTTQPLRLRNY